MRLVGQIHIHMQAESLLREPTRWEKLKRALGADLDLQTGRVRNQLEATGVVDGARRAIGRLGVSNAISLVIDDTVLFQDTDGRPDDLPDLVLALSEHASVFNQGFRELKFAAEHHEAGVHLVIETRAWTEHPQSAPSAIVSIGGRIAVLEPQKGESAEAYRARVEPLTTDRSLFETARLQFESFIDRLDAALRSAMPEARIERKSAEAKLVKAPAGAPHTEVAPQDPRHPAYDPYLVYAPSPMGAMLDMWLMMSFMHMMMPPHVMVVHPSGADVGSMEDVAANPELASADNADPGIDAVAGDAEPALGYEDENQFGGDGDGGGFDSGGGGFDDGGGGFDGGDFGGFD